MWSVLWCVECVLAGVVLCVCSFELVCCVPGVCMLYAVLCMMHCVLCLCLLVWYLHVCTGYALCTVCCVSVAVCCMLCHVLCVLCNLCICGDGSQETESSLLTDPGCPMLQDSQS